MSDLVDDFMKNMRSLNRKEYIYNIITYGIAPTISGDKCGTVINFSNKYLDSYEIWRNNNKEFLSNIPIKNFELNLTKNECTVLFYDKRSLENLLNREGYFEFLYNYGYDKKVSLEEYLYRLKLRYMNACPHEIGLFLGIPLHDVLGFIKNSGKNYLYCGYWKVYNELEEALKVFERYNEAKRKVMKLVGEGKKAFEVIELLQIDTSKNRSEQF